MVVVVGVVTVVSIMMVIMHVLPTMVAVLIMVSHVVSPVLLESMLVPAIVRQSGVSGRHAHERYHERDSETSTKSTSTRASVLHIQTTLGDKRHNMSSCGALYWSIPTTTDQEVNERHVV